MRNSIPNYYITFAGRLGMVYIYIQLFYVESENEQEVAQILVIIIPRQNSTALLAFKE